MTEVPQLPRAIEKALTLFVELQAMDGAVQLSELSRRTGLAKSTTHRLLSALAVAGVAVRAGSHYQIASRWRTDRPTVESDNRRLLHGLAPFLGDLAIRTRLTASIAVLRGTDVVFPHRVYGHDTGLTPNDDTDRAPAHLTAAGRLLLAYDEVTTRRVFEKLSPQSEEAAELSRSLWPIKRTHFAVDTAQHGTTCVAVPLHRNGGHSNVAFVVKGRSDRIDLDLVLHQLRGVAGVAARQVCETRRVA
jgi:DNA-binding IclR family transcriptional regulator